MPFVVQLVGEYVIDIVADIERSLDLGPSSPAAAVYGRFVADNGAYFDLTSQRVTSYWNCYQRSRYPVRRPASGSEFDVYPGFSLIESLRTAARAVGLR